VAVPVEAESKPRRRRGAVATEEKP
jgi:hypothetical protein